MADTFDVIYEGNVPTTTISGADQGSGGGGISESDADARYFRQSQAFDELATADIDTALTNLGLKDGNRDLDLQSLSVNGTNLFPDNDPQTLGTGDNVTHADGTFTGALSADTLRPDTGKFLSPTAYQFRNAGDSGYRSFTAESGNFHPNSDTGFGVTVQRNSGTGRAQLSLYDETDSLLWRFGQTAGGGTEFNFFDGSKDFLSLIPADSSAELDANWKISGYQLIDRDGNFSSGSYYRVEHFADDTLGIGWGATPNALTFETNNDLTTGRNLFVMGGLFAQEFVVEQTRVMFDFRMAPGGGKIESVSGSAGAETITLSDEFQAANPLSAGAIIRIQQRTGQSSGVIIKNIVRRVDSINGMDASLATSGITWGTGDDVGSIESGDDVVYEGHVSDSTLDHYIHYDISGVAIPAIRFWDEVNDVGGGFEPLRVGGMDGYDGSITGDIGIAGKTKTDGAVFWITEDEARLGNFTIKDEYLTDQNIYIGNNLSSFIDAGRIYVGNRLDGTQPRIGIVGGSTDDFMEFFYNNAGSWGVTGRIGGDDVFRFGSTNLIAGAFFDSTGMWAGGSATSNPATKSDSNFWAKFDTGELFYDALVITVWARDTIAGFGAGSTADSLQNNEWTAQRSSSVAGENVIENKIKARYRHRFGINNMLLNYLIRVDSSGDGTGTGAVYLTVRDQSGTSVASDNIDLGPSGITEDTLEVDISSLNPGQYYVVEVDLEAQVGNVNSGTVTITSYLREDAIIYATT